MTVRLIVAALAISGLVALAMMVSRSDDAEVRVSDTPRSEATTAARSPAKPTVAEPSAPDGASRQHARAARSGPGLRHGERHIQPAIAEQRKGLQTLLEELPRRRRELQESGADRRTLASLVRHEERLRRELVALDRDDDG